MASVDGERRTGRDVPAAVIPIQRDSPEDAAVRADDELIESVRVGSVPSEADPVALLLAAWHAEVNRPR
ncbi:MAG: hypothetical protein L0H84_20595 [Pseudonocardia sp.]|nr:hypothetical protein [Pseudonocardia sp.]